MENSSNDIQKKLQANAAIMAKELEAENKKYLDQIKIKMAKLKANGMNDEKIKEYLFGGTGLMMWDAHKNKIRSMVAGFISKIAELSYYQELRNG